MHSASHRRILIAAVCAVGLAVVAAAGFLLRTAQQHRESIHGGDNLTALAPSQGFTDKRFTGKGESIAAQVDAFCGACHAVPRPGSFPKAAWHKEVAQGFQFYRDSGRVDLQVPPEGPVVAHFERQAPVTLTLPDAADENEPQSLAFQRAQWLDDGNAEIMEIAHVHRLQLEKNGLP